MPHATACLALNEDEPRLKEDILRLVEKLTGGAWGHNIIDRNAEAHLGSVLLGPTLTIPISEGKLIRGAWQDILFIELDGPRENRSVVLTFLGEGK